MNNVMKKIVSVYGLAYFVLLMIVLGYASQQFLPFRTCFYFLRVLYLQCSDISLPL